MRGCTYSASNAQHRKVWNTNCSVARQIERLYLAQNSQILLQERQISVFSSKDSVYSRLKVCTASAPHASVTRWTADLLLSLHLPQPDSDRYVASFIDLNAQFKMYISKANTHATQHHPKLSQNGLNIAPQYMQRNKIQAQMSITRDSSDWQTLDLVRRVLGCGKIVQLKQSKATPQGRIQFIVSKKKDIQNKVLPFLFRNSDCLCVQRRCVACIVLCMNLLTCRAHTKQRCLIPANLVFRYLQHYLSVQQGKRARPVDFVTFVSRADDFGVPDETRVAGGDYASSSAIEGVIRSSKQVYQSAIRLFGQSISSVEQREDSPLPSRLANRWGHAMGVNSVAGSSKQAQYHPSTKPKSHTNALDSFFKQNSDSSGLDNSTEGRQAVGLSGANSQAVKLIQATASGSLKALAGTFSNPDTQPTENADNARLMDDILNLGFEEDFGTSQTQADALHCVERVIERLQQPVLLQSYEQLYPRDSLYFVPQFQLGQQYVHALLDSCACITRSPGVATLDIVLLSRQFKALETYLQCLECEFVSNGSDYVMKVPITGLISLPDPLYRIQCKANRALASLSNREFEAKEALEAWIRLAYKQF